MSLCHCTELDTQTLSQEADPYSQKLFLPLLAPKELVVLCMCHIQIWLRLNKHSKPLKEITSVSLLRFCWESFFLFLFTIHSGVTLSWSTSKWILFLLSWCHRFTTRSCSLPVCPAVQSYYRGKIASWRKDLSTMAVAMNTTPAARCLWHLLWLPTQKK